MPEQLSFTLLQSDQSIVVLDCVQVTSGAIELQLQQLPMLDKSATLTAVYGSQDINISGNISFCIQDKHNAFARLSFDAKHDMALRTFVQLFYMQKYAQENGTNLDDLEAVAQDWAINHAAKFSAVFDKAMNQV